jgi:nucleotide-binding universal stress UspA family protein
MRIVVGVSPTTGSPTALRWAANEAELRKVPLRAVLAWRPPRPPAAPRGRPTELTIEAASTDFAAQADQALRAFVIDALGNDDGVECLAVKGGPIKALLGAADGAELLVIGEPGAGRLAEAKMNRLMAPRVILNAPCPVVVMPGSASAAD